MKKNSTFADRVNFILEKEHLSTATLAKKLNSPDQSIRNVVAGRNNPSYETIVSLLNAFDWVTADWLVLGIDPNTTSTYSLQQLHSIIEKQHDTIDMLTRRLIQDIDTTSTSQKIG